MIAACRIWRDRRRIAWWRKGRGPSRITVNIAAVSDYRNSQSELFGGTVTMSRMPIR